MKNPIKSVTIRSTKGWSPESKVQLYLLKPNQCFPGHIVIKANIRYLGNKICLFDPYPMGSQKTLHEKLKELDSIIKFFSDYRNLYAGHVERHNKERGIK